MSEIKTAPANYEVVQSREIAGQYRQKGETIALTAAQAKYYLPPYGTGLKPVDAKTPAKPNAAAEGADSKAAKTDA